MTDLEHKTIKAAATATDRGEFSALAATYSVDRVNERIIPGAFEKTIEKWQGADRNIPLHWDHSGAAEDIIGYVDPGAMRETDDGLYVEGRLDLKSSGVAREAWRSMRNNAVALSFGYLQKTRDGKDGVTEIVEVDLFEVSIVPAPANPDTRLLSLKGWKRAARIEEILDESQSFPADNSTAVEDEKDEEARPKSIPQDPLVREAWDLVLPKARRLPPLEPEPEPEPLDAAKVAREAWAIVMKTSG